MAVRKAKDVLEKYGDLKKLKKTTLIELVEELSNVPEPQKGDNQKLKNEILELTDKLTEESLENESLQKVIDNLEKALSESEMNNFNLKHLFKSYIAGSIIVFIILFILIITL